MTSVRVRIAAALGTLCAVAVVASCSNSSSTDQHATRSTTTTPSAQTAEAQPGVHNADDVAFARGQNPDPIGMAKSIITTQQAEIDQTKQMLGG